MSLHDANDSGSSWVDGGRKLVYLASGFKLTAVDIIADPSFNPANPEALPASWYLPGFHAATAECLSPCLWGQACRAIYGGAELAVWVEEIGQMTSERFIRQAGGVTDQLR